MRRGATLLACPLAQHRGDHHQQAPQRPARADALLFGRVIYTMMEAAWRLPMPAGSMPAWTEPFARTIHAAKNVGTGNGAELATYIVEKGKPLVVPAK